MYKLADRTSYPFAVHNVQAQALPKLFLAKIGLSLAVSESEVGTGVHPGGPGVSEAAVVNIRKLNVYKQILSLNQSTISSANRANS